MLTLRKFLPLLLLPALLAGCATTATFTNLTPKQQMRNANGLYPVEVALSSRQQTLRWETIKPYAVMGDQFIEMRRTPLMTNRWETLLPVSAGTNIAHYHYKFDFEYNAIPTRRTDSAISPEYTLRILDK